MSQATIKEYIAGLVCEAMYMEREELDADELFSDFGLESTTLVKILVKINDQYDFEVKVEEFLLYQTLNDAAGFIYKRIAVSP
jgi:acyl carrier protein